MPEQHLPAAQGELQHAYERLQKDSAHEVSRLRKQCDSLAVELQDQAEQMATLREELAAHGGDVRLRAKLHQLEQQHAEERNELNNALSKHKKEVPESSVVTSPGGL